MRDRVNEEEREWRQGALRCCKAKQPGWRSGQPLAAHAQAEKKRQHQCWAWCGTEEKKEGEAMAMRDEKKMKRAAAWLALSDTWTMMISSDVERWRHWLCSPLNKKRERDRENKGEEESRLLWGSRVGLGFGLPWKRKKKKRKEEK